MKSHRFISVTTNIGTVAMLVFLYFFVSFNAPGLVALYAVVAVAVVYAVVYLTAITLLLNRVNAEQGGPRAGAIERLLLLLLSIVLLAVFVDATVMDYYQPLSLYDEAIGLLALWWLLLLVSNIAGLFASRSVARALLVATLAALLSAPFAASLWWINAPSVNSEVSLAVDVYTGGEDGYDIYRIPGMVLLPAGSALAAGDPLESDRILAFAEARRNGALDTGDIDLVMKVSDDGGRSWSDQKVICTHRKDEQRGKCGNPTPLFDEREGRVVLGYNLSGLEDEGRHHSTVVMSSDDGGLSWGAPVTIASDNFVFGPGKGIQKQHPPHAGRLMLPGYIPGSAGAYYSDDHGASWKLSPFFEGGNETDLAETGDGRLYLSTRHSAPIGRAPSPNGRLFSISSDGGDSWPALSLDEALPTPVCQVAVINGDDEGLIFSNPAHIKSRVKLTLRYSADAGATWPRELLVYPGPTGYSVLAQATDGDILALYENGNMSYSERISIARIPRESLLPSNQNQTDVPPGE
ncbi:exo-alpha-sialidase [Halioglobus maricola]|uniref:exo-alpha-sialidase n=1 Tax=Halioglobus maricola TaxID=2601894 RepID=A0A5P9NHY8_9GAMM|nr:sialidase family protein [Halioglobus maricola]QFU75447.1 exo-alpha-sialidase [Halioglobus maricola]